MIEVEVVGAEGGSGRRQVFIILLSVVRGIFK